MSKKYLKNEKGTVGAITSDNLGLEKPLANENYDIEVHNRNIDKIDSAIQEVRGKIDSLELVASKVAMNDGSTVEVAVTANKTSISTNTNNINTNTTNIGNLTTKVNKSQLVKVTGDSGECISIPNSNANDINKTGFWMGSNVANAPTNGWVYIESLVHNSLYQVQKVTDLHDSSKRWTRHQTGGSWSEWREL